MSKSLVDYLKEIRDPRKPQGSTQDFWKLLLVIIMGIMSGYQGLGRFVERHRSSLIEKLKLKHGQAPSYPTLRRVMMNVETARCDNSSE